MMWLAIIVEGASLHYFHVGILLAIQVLHALIRLYGTTKPNKKPPAASKRNGMCQQVVDDPLLVPLLPSESGIPHECLVKHPVDDDEDDEVALPTGDVDEVSLPGGESPEYEENPLVSRDTVFVTQLAIADPYGERGVYTGVLCNSTGMPHGKGQLKYEKENRWYEGDWLHGRWNGNGSLSNGDGDYYQGGLTNDRKHGSGVLRFADGRVFEGEFIRDQMTQGKMTYQDGSSYEGSWVDGMRHGRGKCIFVDGSEYEGEFQKGNFHGDGQMTWSDGGWYLGEWYDNEIHGTGKEIRPDGSLRHDGEWSKGRPVRRSADSDDKDEVAPVTTAIPGPLPKLIFVQDNRKSSALTASVHRTLHMDASKKNDWNIASAANKSSDEVEAPGAGGGAPTCRYYVEHHVTNALISEYLQQPFTMEQAKKFLLSLDRLDVHYGNEEYDSNEEEDEEDRHVQELVRTAKEDHKKAL